MPSEFDLIARHFSRPARGAVLGVGDDAALVRASAGCELAVATDMLVEGTHFLPGADARALGHKSLAVNLSDMAAMGAAPRWATLALALPAADEAWLAAFSAGLYALAERFGTDLVGGDTTRGPLCIAIGIIGEVAAGRALRRSGAQPGDDVWVSGELGGAALGLAGLQGRAALEPADAKAMLLRLHEPEPRVALGRRLIGVASAAIDVSDGLAGDLGHILERSGVGATVQYAALPRPAAFAHLGDAELERRCLLSGGDDYELVFTAAPAQRGSIAALALECGVAATRIGTIEAGAPRLRIVDSAGRPLAQASGYDHFAPPS